MVDKTKKAPVLATIIFYILGVCSMLPWNFFITADPFWQYKLRNVTLMEDWNAHGADLTKLQVSFTPALVIISNLICFIFAFVTSALTKCIGEKKRIIFSLLVSLLNMLTVTALAFINTDQWQKWFFIVTLVLVALLNVGIAIFQASLYGAVGVFPDGCIASLYSGQSLAGVVSSLAQIISLAIGNADPVLSGILYFSIADIFLIVSTGAYIYFIKSEFYMSAKSAVNERPQKYRSSNKWKDYFRILRKIFWMGFTLGFALLVTLAIFPAVQVYVTSTHAGTLWGDVYYQPAITFLGFNLFDMIGRETTKIFQWPKHDSWLMHILAASRIIFIPLILLCHGENKTFPTLFNKDLDYIILNLLFGLTNGYFTSLAMVYFPRLVNDQEIEVAGTLMASLMGVGLIIGSGLSPVFLAVWGPT